MPASKVQYVKVCPVCGNRFKAKTLYSVVCSDKCRDIAKKAKEKSEREEKARLQRINEMPVSDYISVSQAVDIYRISKDAIYRLIRSGRLPAEKYGPRLTRIKKSDLENMSLVKLPEAVVSKDEDIEEHRLYCYRFDDSDCYTIGEINQKFALHDTTIWSAIRKKGIPICYRGNYAYVPRDIIDELFSDQI